MNSDLGRSRGRTSPTAALRRNALRAISAEALINPFTTDPSELVRALNAAWRIAEIPSAHSVPVALRDAPELKRRIVLMNSDLWKRIQNVPVSRPAANGLAEFVEDHRAIFEYCARFRSKVSRHSHVHQKAALQAVEENLTHFRAIVESWRIAGGGIAWAESSPAYWTEINEMLVDLHFELRASRAGMVLATHLPKSDDVYREAQHYFTGLFVGYSVSPEQPLSTCKGCGRYFLKTAKRTDYHDQICARQATAKLAKKSKRHMEAHKKLRAVASLISEFPVHTALDWKGWVVERVARKHSIELVTRDWLTRISNRDGTELAVPDCDECARWKHAIQVFAARR